MEKAYWLSRRSESLEQARSAASSEARLIHYELAGRYAVNASAAIPTQAVELAESLPPAILRRRETDGA